MEQERANELQQVFRTTGYLTNGQAWDIVELVDLIVQGAGIDKLREVAERMRIEAFGR